MTSLRTLLVDDSPEFLNSVERFFATQTRIVIVGRAASGHEAVEQTAHLQPDLVLMDWRMPQGNGLEATRRLKAEPSPPRVIMLTGHDSPRYRTAAVEAGADGFVVKDDFGATLLPLIETLWPATGEAPGE